MIQDETLNITLEEEFNKEVTTKKLNGYIESILIDASKPIRLEMTFDEHKDINLLTEKNLRGKKFFLLRKQTQKNSEEAFNYAPEKIAINNKLRFTIRGERHSKTTIIVRYS